jgi:hypothetical protein
LSSSTSSTSHSSRSVGSCPFLVDRLDAPLLLLSALSHLAILALIHAPWCVAGLGGAIGFVADPQGEGPGPG